MIAVLAVVLVAAVGVADIIRSGWDGEPTDTAITKLQCLSCDALPAGDDPGSPESIVGLDAVSP